MTVSRWLCVRCQAGIRSDGPPVSCLTEQGGCGRKRADLACELASTDERHADGCEDCRVGATAFDGPFPTGATVAGMLAPMSLGKAISILKTVLDHPDPLFHASIILGAAQDYVIDLLKTCVYIVFSGGPDTGKGTANACAMALTRNGILLGGASGPYLRDTLGSGRAVAISEFETLLRENAQLLVVVRNGNRRDTSKTGLKIPAGKGWTNAEVDTFGFKTMDFHDRLDAHVLGRALQFEMVRSKDLDVAMNAEHLRERLAPVREWIAERAAEARERGWTAARVWDVWDSPEFRARVRKFKNAWGRHGIIAADLLLINDIFELGLEDEIRKLMDAREPELSEIAQEVQESIDELVGEDFRPEMEIRVSDVLARVNAIRRERGLRERPRIDGALRELGFNPKSQDWVRARENRGGPNRGKAIILPFEKVRTWRSSSDEVGAKGAMDAISPYGVVTPLAPMAPSLSEPLPIWFRGREVPSLRSNGGREVPPKRLHDEIAWRVRAKPDIPASFIWKEVAPALQLPEDADTRAVVEGYAEALKAMHTWPELHSPFRGNVNGTREGGPK